LDRPVFSEAVGLGKKTGFFYPIFVAQKQNTDNSKNTTGMGTTAKKKTEKKTEKAVPGPYVVLEDGRKVSRTWAAFLEAEKDPGIEILDMRAVVYGVYETEGR